jgi:hypothetical protein
VFRVSVQNSRRPQRGARRRLKIQVSFRKSTPGINTHEHPVSLRWGSSNHKGQGYAVSAAIQNRWTPADKRKYAALVKAGVEPVIIAKRLRRTLISIVNRGQIENKRRWRARQHQEPTRIQIEPQYVAPPAYVLRERVIRYSIPQTSLTQMVFHDPVAGYSALASKARKLSVQDALEICALYTGNRGEIVTLAASYGVSQPTVSRILDGSFFESLLPDRACPAERLGHRDD